MEDTKAAGDTTITKRHGAQSLVATSLTTQVHGAGVAVRRRKRTIAVESAERTGGNDFGKTTTALVVSGARVHS